MCRWLVWFPALLLVQIWKKMGRPCSWSSKEGPPEAPTPLPPPRTPQTGRHGAAGQSQSLLPDPPETYRPFGDVIRPLMRVHGCWLLTHPVEGGVLGNFMCGTPQQPLCPWQEPEPHTRGPAPQPTWGLGDTQSQTSSCPQPAKECSDELATSPTQPKWTVKQRGRSGREQGPQGVLSPPQSRGQASGKDGRRKRQ